ncbi:MAG TPA: hypothetical protein VFI65_16815 [Streptosporangiaceae bacterium]|nr:hypothetical protein [Streptosporangiaceae bacterium]
MTKEIARRRRTEQARLRALARTGADRPAAEHADQVAASVSAQAAGRALSRALRTLAPADRDKSLPGPTPAIRRLVLSGFAEPPERTRARQTRTRRVAIAGALAVVAGLATAPWWGGAPAIDAQAAQIFDKAALAAGHQQAPGA